MTRFTAGRADRLTSAALPTSPPPEALRQAAAETLALHAMAIAARHHDLRAAGGGPAMQDFREEVAAAVAQRHGPDLRRFALTPVGFEPR